MLLYYLSAADTAILSERCMLLLLFECCFVADTAILSERCMLLYYLNAAILSRCSAADTATSQMLKCPHRWRDVKQFSPVYGNLIDC